MTCLVGIEAEGRVLVGGDSAACSGSRVILRAGGKVRQLAPDIVVGAAGSTRAQQVLRTHVDIPSRAGMHDPEDWVVREFIPALKKGFEAAGWLQTENGRTGADETYFLLGVRDQLFAIWTDFQVERSIHGYHAMGSGAYYALGALHATAGRGEPEDRLRGALEAAATFDAYVEAPFAIVEAAPGGDRG